MTSALNCFNLAPFVIEVERVSKRLGSRQVLDDVSFGVREGEVFGFLGPNGAGKTTTIRVLLGLLRADTGSARIGGHNCWQEHNAAARLVGATVETPGFYGYFTGRRNLIQFSRLLGRVDHARIREALELVGLTSRADDKVKRYSLGMRQRLAVAQALLGNPLVLILDEPTNGLDPNGIHDLRVLLRRLVKELGVTVFFSSHLLAEAQDLCDRVAVISAGAIRTVGPLDELLAAGDQVRVEVQVSDVVAARRVIETIDGARVSDAGPDRLLVAGRAMVPRYLAHALIAAGVGVDEMVRVDRRLEDLYLELTTPSVLPPSTAGPAP